jgi:hypothetical protein
MGRKKRGSRVLGPYRHGIGWKVVCHIGGRRRDPYFVTREEADAFASETALSIGRIVADSREPRECLPVSCTVYAIRSGVAGPIKFGSAVSVRKRMHYLQVGNPEPLILLALFCPSHWAEEVIHQKLIAHRGRGEWFAAGAEVVEFVILEHCIAGPGMEALRK